MPRTAPNTRAEHKGSAHTAWFRYPQNQGDIFRCYNYFFRNRIRVWSHALNRASAGLETVIAAALHRAPASQSALLAWPVACGSSVADRTRVLDFCDGILRVEVADAGWRRELANLAPRYVASINRYSAAAVKRIEFVVKA
jgi:hypothetical protein